MFADSVICGVSKTLGCATCTEYIKLRARVLHSEDNTYPNRYFTNQQYFKTLILKTNPIKKLNSNVCIWLDPKFYYPHIFTLLQNRCFLKISKWLIKYFSLALLVSLEICCIKLRIRMNISVRLENSRCFETKGHNNFEVTIGLT